MKLMILGAGQMQVNAIKKAESMNHKVIAVDYYKNSIGKKYSSYSELADIFNIDECLKAAIKHDIDGILTVGTDQSVHTMTVIAEKLNLPKFLNSNVSKNVTNKAYMKKIFDKNNIPTVKYKLIDKNYSFKEFDLNFPVVIKPVDSQGQRGIFVVNSISEIKEKFNDVIYFSRDNVILAEEYYKNTEITISGWVHKGKTTIFTITDRVTFKTLDKIGICTSHEYPTMHMKHREDIEKITLKIVKAFNINEGAIYFQMFFGDDGIKVNEIACRIGGAYEDIFIPYLTGIDILEMSIKYALGLDIDYSKLNNYDYKKNKKYLSSQLFFAKTGKVKKVNNNLNNVKHLLSYGYNYNLEENIPNIKNATQRAGHFIVFADTLEEKNKRINNIYKEIYIKDENNNNLIIVND